MADNHLQVNLDGSLDLRKTQLWGTVGGMTKEDIIRNIFERDGWKVSILENVTGPHWKVITSFHGIHVWRINLFISSIRDESRKEDEYKMQLGTKTYPSEESSGWHNLVLGIYTICEPANDRVEYLLSAYNISSFDFSTNPSLRGTRTEGLQIAKMKGFHETKLSVIFRPDFIYFFLDKYLEKFSALNSKTNTQQEDIKDLETLRSTLNSYFPIIRTKPFLLLAGISGTGKSRIVKEMAFASCPDKGDLRKDKVAPGNYLLVEVKPNWHDSTELMGYESSIKQSYVLTPFIKFLYKAMRYPSVPFFVCLDEMNLAPVEQYFAEFLSVLESRKQIDVETIVSEPLIKKSIFKKYELEQELLRDDEETEEYKTSDPAFSYSSEYEELRENGLRIPQNVIVVGTVNMDETTHQFSRKVIDRAMTIEMNEVNFDDFFESNKELHYYSTPIAADNFICKYSSASQAMVAFDEEEVATIKENVPASLKELNSKLENTPFKVAYRVQNEIILYLAALKEEKTKAGQAYEIENLINKAFDDIMLMKVLPRIEGDTELLSKPLDALYGWAKDFKRSSDKIKEMKDRLDSGSNFTSFWP